MPTPRTTDVSSSVQCWQCPLGHTASAHSIKSLEEPLVTEESMSQVHQEPIRRWKGLGFSPESSSCTLRPWKKVGDNDLFSGHSSGKYLTPKGYAASSSSQNQVAPTGHLERKQAWIIVVRQTISRSFGPSV